jgi:hypothetical protein
MIKGYVAACIQPCNICQPDLRGGVKVDRERQVRPEFWIGGGNFQAKPFIKGMSAAARTELGGWGTR